MSTNSHKNDDQEMDLMAVSRGIKNFFGGLNTFFYNCVRFVIRNIVLLSILVIVGGALGYFMDHSLKKVYTNQIIVSPNFGSTDYLYSKIDLIDSKISERDTMFLKSIGIKNPKDLIKIEISPIIDLYKFVSSGNTELNYKLVELMAQDGDIKKVAVESTTSKNYPFHTITFSTRGITTKERTVAPLLAYLNDNQYFKAIQKEYLKNQTIKLRANDVMIGQIDTLLSDFANKSPGGQVNINEGSQLNDIIKTKDELIKEQGNKRIDIVGLDKVVKDNSTIINIKDKSAVNGKMKFVLPLVFILIFLAVYFFRAFYRKQNVKHSTK